MTAGSTHQDESVIRVDVIKEAARMRGGRLNLAYAGAVVPAEAFALHRAGIKLVDVRTQAELYWVGRIPGALALEWSGFPGNVLNANFLVELEGIVGKVEPVMFLCRSGNRSHDAAQAAAGAGWRECYNVLEGFEGDRNAEKHRNTIAGWRVAGLPWTQS